MDAENALGDPLTLVSFASEGATRALSRDLSSLGFRNEIRDGPAWLRTETGSDVPGPLVCLIDESADEKLIYGLLLGRLKGAPWLCACRHGERVGAGELLRASTEFMESPWSRRELALRMERLCNLATRRLGKVAANQDFAALNMIGRSSSFRAALAVIGKAAGCTAPVLISGETGTGKELAARAVHYLGGRKGGPFVPVNCGAIPDNLFENEIFGHEKGAFTDARSAQEGLAGQANGGTLFLDEVEALSPKGQVTLLRFLQDLEVRPLGAARARKVDVRILAATNASLSELIEAGRFRADLFFRLNVVVVELPALCEREGDAEVLAHHFLAKFASLYGLEDLCFDPGTLSWLGRQRWPGNVRELENFIHRGVVQAEDGRICLRHLLQQGRGWQTAAADGTGEPGLDTFQVSKDEAIAQFERRYLERLLTDAKGNVTLAAKRAGKERRALGKLLKKHGLEREQFNRAGSETATPGRI